ncbi:hypothetical protein ACTFIU_007154 [Dictyostelium citrinum]
MSIGLLTCCNNGTYGDQCQYIECPLDCSTPNGICDKNTCICDCDDKYSGEGCDFILCPLNCSTPNGVCDDKTGECDCDDKHSGDHCDFIKYPLDCSIPNGKTGTSKHGMCDTYTLDCICDTQTKGLLCEESRLLIEAVEPTSKEGGTTTITGYFGVTTSLLSIKIGDCQCNNIQRESDSKLKCEIGPGEGTHNITITDDDLSHTGVGMFQYVGQINKIPKISGGDIAGRVVSVSVIGAGDYYQYHLASSVSLVIDTCK